MAAEESVDGDDHRDHLSGATTRQPLSYCSESAETRFNATSSVGGVGGSNGGEIGVGGFVTRFFWGDRMATTLNVTLEWRLPWRRRELLGFLGGRRWGEVECMVVELRRERDITALGLEGVKNDQC